VSSKVLQRFGVLRTNFRGTGSVRLSDGSDARARFTLGQLADAELIICADVAGRAPWEFLKIEAEGLQGTLADGRRIDAAGLMIKECQSAPGATGTRLVAYSTHWTIAGPSIVGRASAVFELVNFIYIGTETEILMVDGLESIKSSLMTLRLGERHAQLRRAIDYDQAVATLKAQRGVQVTCTATTTISSSPEIDDVVSMMDTLCCVMSVARGTLVSWTSFEVRDASERALYSRYINSVTRRYAGTGPLSPIAFNDTKRFLEEGFKRCEELDSDFHVRKIARAYVETRDGDFIESRSLLIAVLVEYLANVRARLDGRTYFLKERDFNAGWKSFKGKAEPALKQSYPGIEEAQALSMLANIKGGLNRQPLKSKLEGLAEWLDIDFAHDEIANFVKVRNKLVHEGRFPDSDTPVKHYQRMQHFVDRVILRLFGYHGPYYDYEHCKKRQI
jgi:hypothetical protein